MSIKEIIGEEVVLGKEQSRVQSSQFEGNGKVLGLYFSAHWCPPCRSFTPNLAEWYKKFKASPNGDKFDIVFVSSDRDEKSFNEYFAEMPWYALPYTNRDLKTKLSRKFKVTGIPTLVFINGENGQLITNDGRSIVLDDPEGKDFPWTPKPVSGMISGELLCHNGKQLEKKTWSDVKETVDAIGIYFSAHWCGPCRSFTPELVKTYNMLKEAGKSFEIIFCSSDRDEASFKEYFLTMPWLAIPFGDARKTSLSRYFDVSGIPTLVILDKDCKTITAQGRSAISNDPDGKEFPWHPKAVNELKGSTAGEINETASLVWFTDGKSDSVKMAEESLLSVAKEYISQWKESDEPPKMFFFYTGMEDDDEIATSLRQFAQLPETNPLLAIVDIPEQKVYTMDGDLTADKVRDFVDKFFKNKLDAKELRR